MRIVLPDPWRQSLRFICNNSVLFVCIWTVCMLPTTRNNISVIATTTIVLILFSVWAEYSVDDGSTVNGLWFTFVHLFVLINVYNYSEQFLWVYYYGLLVYFRMFYAFACFFIIKCHLHGGMVSSWVFDIIFLFVLSFVNSTNDCRERLVSEMNKNA